MRDSFETLKINAMKNKLIAIVLPNLKPGGVERMRIVLIKYFLSQGYAVDLVLMREAGALTEEVPKEVNIVNLRKSRYRGLPLSLCLYLKNRKPDVLLSAMWPLNIISVLAVKLIGHKIRLVISEHSILSEAYAEKGKIHSFFLKLSIRALYPLAHSRIAVSKGVVDDLQKISGNLNCDYTVVGNPASMTGGGERILEMPKLLNKLQAPIILSVGTLKLVKNHELLILAFFELLKTRDATLVIIGEGVQRPRLEKLIAELGLIDKVLLPGFYSDISSWYTYSDLFVLSSNHEGFGNVIVEALSHGLPVVSTDCPSGPREILCDGKYGRLVPVGDVRVLADAMHAALSETPDRDSLRARALDFSVEKTATKYLDAMFPDHLV